MPFEPMMARMPPGSAERHLNLSKQDAAFRPATVKQKVKQWQGEGGGVMEKQSPAIGTPKAPASPARKELGTPKKLLSPVVTPVYEKRAYDLVKDLKNGQHAIVKTRSPATPKQKAPTATFDPERRAWIRKRVDKPTDHVTPDMKEATSPKKRVVSDSHWMKERSPATPKQETTPKYISVTDMKHKKVVAQKSTPNFRSKPSGAKASPNIPWAIRTKAPREKTVWTTWNPAKDPVYQATQRKSSPSRSPPRQGESSSVNVAHTAHKPASKSATPVKTPRKATDGYGSDSSVRIRGSSARKASRPKLEMTKSDFEHEIEGAFSLASPVPDDSISRVGLRPVQDRIPRKEVGSGKSSGAAPLFDRNGLVTKDRTRSTPAPKATGNRIEAWLGGQKSPTSTEATSSKGAPPSVPEPIRPQKREHQRQASRGREPLRTSGSNRQFSFEHGDETATIKVSPTNKENNVRSRDSSAQQARARKQSEDLRNALHYGSSGGIGLGIDLRREFPSTGKPLSTIASVITQETRAKGPPMPSRGATSYAASSISLNTIGGRVPAPERKKSSALKRTLTKHDDLMSVLSVPNGLGSLASARTFRSQMTKMDKITVEATMKELAEQESTYQSELQALVDGVIPALLSSVLSKRGSDQVSKVFEKDSRTKVTQPIVDMGVAMERLRSQHKRMPQSNPAALLIWAQNAAKIYDDYINAWRMGFNDVVVNIPQSDKSEWHRGLSRNAAGDLINAKGERVDVAFLLKRPLVRVKNLTKTFRAINYCTPSMDADSVAERFHALVLAARKKSSSELARLEDEAANTIDPTRARDPRSLAPLAGVRIDQTRSVRARDYFEMTLRHSTGQQIDCAIEIFIRDNEADPQQGGDVLICEVSDHGRWLLFPPFVQDMVSARRGKSDLDLILMLRGVSADYTEWSEVVTLHASSDEAVDEWATMLAEGPTPPSPTRTTFTMSPDLDQEDMIPKPLTPRPRSAIISPQPQSPGGRSERTVTFKSRTPSPKEIEIPIGEQARKTSKRWSFSLGNAAAELLGQATPGVFKRAAPTQESYELDDYRPSRSMPASPALKSSLRDPSRDRNTQGEQSPARNLPLRPALSRSSAARSTLTSSMSAPTSPRSDYTESTLRSQYPPRSSSRRPSLSRSKPTTDSFRTDDSGRDRFSVWLPSEADRMSDEEAISDGESDDHAREKPRRPSLHLRTASSPSLDMPVVPRLRKREVPQQTQQHRPVSPLKKLNGSSFSSDNSRDAPSSAPGKLQKIGRGLKIGSKDDSPRSADTPTRPKSSFFSTPNFLKRKSRPASPLKRQYTVSMKQTDSDSEYSEVDALDDSDADSLSSYSSDEGEKYDAFDAQKPPMVSPPLFARKTPPQSLASVGGTSLAPSNSASQGPFRSVPQQATDTCTKTVANIFSWSDRGVWDPLHPVEVTVVVSPGLIEAFSMSELRAVPKKNEAGMEASPSQFGIKPLVALELTPLVPLRRGTALDISIRSPPTPNSQIASSSNVMFRSRSPEECEFLYNLINQARINNATYIALQNARPSDNTGTWAAQIAQRNALRSSSNNTHTSWFGLGSRRGSTYRSNSVRYKPGGVGGGNRHASLAASESSIGTMNTAFSALRRLSGTGMRAFSSRFENSSGGGNSNSDGAGGLNSGYATPSGGGGAPGQTPLGIAEVKIRLYRRETANKWRDMGSARLSIIPVSAKAKRILVCGATKGETLLDETLQETAFERVARTGIAVNIWREIPGAADTGGVAAGKMDVFMVQMKTERDAAYTFGLVGKLRY